MATLPKSLATHSSPHTKKRAKLKGKAAPGVRTLSISEAKTHLLSIVDNVQTDHRPITITKRGQPVAQIIPFAPAKRVSGYGCMKGTATILGDIVSPDHAAWESKS